MTKKKLVASGVALAMAAVLALTGTFAWQSISQKARNDAQATLNPGGRLHDDFNGSIKRVYVENFTDENDGGVPIYARIRLYEYMEIGEGAGKRNQDGSKADENKATSVVTGKAINAEDAWTIHGNINDKTDSDKIALYWNWTQGGQTMYMPTFDKDKDSLAADVNGTYEGTAAGDNVHYDDFTDWTKVSTKTAKEYYDNDNDSLENDHSKPADTNGNGWKQSDTEIEHTTKQTLTAEVITMDQWLDANGKNGVAGDFWVLDTDGWYYWANPVKPGTATGMLLSGISLKNPMSDSWYYSINVEAQFATADDLGWKDINDPNENKATGFYLTGSEPSANAEKLLAAAGAIPKPVADTLKIMLNGQAIDNTDVAKGATANFSVEASLLGNKVDDSKITGVKWTISGAKSATTTIDESAGALTVGADETATAFVVTATYPDYALKNIGESAVSVSIVVNVTTAP